MKVRITTLGMMAALCLLTGNAAAQTPASGQTANPLSASAKRTYEVIKGYLTRAAEKMPEEHYAFQPSKDVRTFGQLVGHLADANYGFCAAAAGEKPPAGGFDGANSIEKTKTSKADLQKGLADSFAYCDKVHAAMTDAAGSAVIKFFGGDLAKLSILEFNTHHEFEHYGNIVTYMRIKGLVPPSSETSR
ncbi:MAG TPA: DinB family protein [Vicinamibacterales bacterium]|nr:DinB family protein [Vicinamibacterales bacterium]